MDNRFKEIFDNTVPHSSFLTENSIMSCMYPSYQLGADDFINWLIEKNYLTENPKLIQNEFHNRDKKPL